MRALRHRDFLLLWLGALFSFTGAWIQNTAQQALVYDLTRDAAKLGLVAFCASAPIAVLGPIAGVLTDVYDKRRLLVLTQVVLATSALVIATTIALGVVQYGYILVAALVAGMMSCLEMPTRQSIVGRVVPAEDLPSAIPLQAMTFNLARVIGPAIGGILLVAVGAQLCYFINGASYVFLIGAALAIRADLTPSQSNTTPIFDLLKEGIRFTFRDRRLRTLFIMESAVSTFGLFYLSVMAAIATEMLRVDKRGLGAAMSVIGIGALLGLLLIAHKGSSSTRGWIVRIAMVTFGSALFALGFADNPWTAFPLLAILGMASIMQFNTTNTLFQMIAPEHLRGRVIAMHVWALAGLGPFGTLLFSVLGRVFGIPVALKLGGVCVLLAAVWGWNQRDAFESLP